MTGKYYGIYVSYQDGTKELLGEKSRLTDLDQFTMQSVDYPSFVFAMKIAYPRLSMKKIKDFHIEYQARGKTKTLGLLFGEDQSLFCIDYVYPKALAYFEHPIFISRLIKPYDDGKNYPLARICHNIIFVQNITPLSGEEYTFYYNLKTEFLRRYLFKEKSGELNYLHMRRIYEVLMKIKDQEVKTLYQIPAEIHTSQESLQVEVDDSLYGMLHDAYLSSAERDYAQEQYEQLGTQKKLLYGSGHQKVESN